MYLLNIINCSKIGSDVVEKKKKILDDIRLMKEWDYEKNDSLALYPAEISYSSNKKVWWKCEKGHSWNTSVYNRTSSKGCNCPICSNKQLLVGYNDLKSVEPNIAKEWDYFKNNPLRPEMVVYSSTKKVWWRCNSCNHEWETEIRHRTTRKKTCCPNCSSKIRGEKRKKTNLEKKGGLIDEKLIKQWDYEKNYPYTPNDFTHGSSEKVWWKCEKGHSFEQRIANRTIKQSNCPYCSNQKLLVGYNDFATMNPDLLKEWDNEKNTNIKLSEVMSGSREKVWWKCSKGHSYQATLNHRTSPNSTGCPICLKGRQTSFAEQAVFYYVKKEFPDAINGAKNIIGPKFELDIFIPSINTAIEYDGEAWHGENTLEREQRKYKMCQAKNIRLIRLKEAELQLGTESCDYSFTYEKLYEDNLPIAIYDLIKFLTFKMHFQMNIDIDINRDRNEILRNMQIDKKDSILITHPEIAAEWHPTLNGDMSPSNFTKGSRHKMWWICPVCNNEYQSTISHRVSGTACPKCGIIRSKKAKMKAVCMIDLKTNEIVEIFDSISDASRKMNISSGNIGLVLNGTRKHTKGYSWRYYDKSNK